MNSRNLQAVGRILLVDGRPTVQDAYRRILAPPGCIDSRAPTEFYESSDWFGDVAHTHDRFAELKLAASYASRGEQAVELALGAWEMGLPYEVALVDLHSTSQDDRLAILERLWEIDSLLQVVLCSSTSESYWSEANRRFGQRDNLLFLKTPFADEEVLRLTTTLIHKRRSTLEFQLQLEQLRQANELLQQEIGHRQTAENKLQHAATHDPLTKLPNRNYLKHVLARRLEESESATDKKDALIFLDVDNFKFINDSLGHHAGDELLIQLADRIQSELCLVCDDVIRDPAFSRESPHNLVARLGGDEFVVFLMDIQSRDQAIRFAESLRGDLCRPYELSGHAVNIGTSLGIAFTSPHVKSSEELMRNADIAMYRAKFTGKRCLAVFDQQMHQSVIKRLDLEAALRSVLQEGGLRLEYQPIFDLKDGAIIGLESLLRWKHARNGAINPEEFIPVAEETGLIIPIGRWVIEEACRTIRQLNSLLPAEHRLAISVNVSRRQIADDQFVEMLTQTLHTNCIAGEQLNLEITESLVMNGPERVVSRLSDIRSLGVRLHMDDFGTGHSSLSCLHRFPIDVLKIDRSFVSTMETNTDYESIIHAIITLAHNLGTTVIAEGIETESQLSRLRNLKCDLGQGFFFSKPKPIEDVIELLLSFRQQGLRGQRGSKPPKVGSIAMALPAPSTVGAGDVAMQPVSQNLAAEPVHRPYGAASCSS